MTHSNTPANGGPTERALYDAWLAGLRQGIMQGALMMLTPADKAKFRKQDIARRKSEMAHSAATLQKGRKHMRYWPKIMPGGWPIPPEVPGDESTFWPEVDGWPCPPPALRGQA